MTMNYNSLMQKNLPKRIYNLLKFIGEMADESRYNTFVVGGFVRDLILGRENLDIDIVMEGDTEAFAKRLAKAKRGKAIYHEQFGTSVVTLHNGQKIDFATARTEIYKRPGALPTVDLGSIEEDLERRDFTINAMAIKLNENRFGELVDYLHGESDLKKGIIKIIHDQSFQDDPTRIFRAIRYEQRYGFRMDKHTESLLKTAVEKDFLNTITKQRLRNEILLILGEENSVKPIDRLDQLKLLGYIHPKISLSENIIATLSKIDRIRLFSNIPIVAQNKEFDAILLKLMAIMNGLNESEANEASKNLALSKKYTEAIVASVAKLPSALETLANESIKPSEIYRTLKGLPIPTLFFGIFRTSDKDTAHKILMYFVVVLLKPFITGKDLKELGYPEGSLYSEILSDVFDAQLDEIVNDKQEAIEYIQKKYKQKG